MVTKHSEKRRASWRAFRASKLASMSPEELAAFREQKRLYDIEYRRKNAEKRAAAKRTPEYLAKQRARKQAKYAAWRALHPARRVLTPEERKARALACGAKHRAAHPTLNKEYYDANRERLLEQKRGYYKANKDAIIAAHNAYQKRRGATDPEWRIVKNCYSRISELMRGTTKSAKTMDLIGCTRRRLRAHLESQFQPGMSWENYGRAGWHIDHKTPCAAFNLMDPEEQKKCFHWTNLQPMWASANFKKSNTLPDGTRAWRADHERRAFVSANSLSPCPPPPPA